MSHPLSLSPHTARRARNTARGAHHTASGARHQQSVWSILKTSGLLLAGLLLLAACGSKDDTPSGGPTPPEAINITNSLPTHGDVGVALSTTGISVSFDKALATTYDSGSWSWPHLDKVLPYILLEDLTGKVPVPVSYLSYDDTTDTLFIGMTYPPQAEHVYKLLLYADLPSEGGLLLPKDVTVSFTAATTQFAAGVYADRVLAGSYLPEVPMGSTKGEGYYVEASILGQPEGSLHVTSMGDDGAIAGGEITVGFGDGTDRYCITNGGGVNTDFIIHENPLSFNDGGATDVNYTEAAYVEVSQDGATYYRFPVTFPDPAAIDLADLVGLPANYSGLAGINVGGDAFDLTDVIAAFSLGAAFEGCYVRIVDAGTEVPDYDSSGLYMLPNGSGADIDAVEALNHVVNSTLTK